MSAHEPCISADRTSGLGGPVPGRIRGSDGGGSRPVKERGRAASGSKPARRRPMLFPVRSGSSPRSISRAVASGSGGPVTSTEAGTAFSRSQTSNASSSWGLSRTDGAMTAPFSVLESRPVDTANPSPALICGKPPAAKPRNHATCGPQRQLRDVHERRLGRPPPAPPDPTSAPVSYPVGSKDGCAGSS
jgi:hypothetical protein